MIRSSMAYLVVLPPPVDVLEPPSDPSALGVLLSVEVDEVADVLVGDEDEEEDEEADAISVWLLRHELSSLCPT